MANFTNPLGRASSTYLGRMTWAELQASAYANGSVGLSGLGADASVFVTDWRVGMVPSAAKTYWGGEVPFAKNGFAAGEMSFVPCVTAITWTLDADPANGKTRLVSSAGHGLTAASNNKRIYTSAWSGTGIVGFYAMTYVDATHIDIAVAYSAGAGNPTITATGAEAPLLTLTVPAALMQANSVIKITSQWSCTNSAADKKAIVRVGGDASLYGSIISSGGGSDQRLVRSLNSKSAQICQVNTSGSAFGGGTPRLTTINMANAFDIVFAARVDAVDNYLELSGYDITISV